MKDEIKKLQEAKKLVLSITANPQFKIYNGATKEISNALEALNKIIYKLQTDFELE